MFSDLRSLIRSRRRKALLLIAAWLVFTASPVFAACCTALAGAFDTASTELADHPQHHSQTVPEESCNSHAPDSEITVQRTPFDASIAGLFPRTLSQPIVIPMVPGHLYPRAAAVKDGPPDLSAGPPITPPYARFQRLLI